MNSLVQVELHEDPIAVLADVGRVERAGGPAVAGAEVRVAVEALCAQLLRRVGSVHQSNFSLPLTEILMVKDS